MLIESEIAQAGHIRQRLEQRLAVLAATPDLTPRGRNRERARAVLAARQQMSDLRAASDVREQSAYDSAYRHAFGLDKARPAEDREIRARLAADPPTAEQAAGMLRRALAIGDDLQARALAALAHEMQDAPLGEGERWFGVLDDYVGSSPQAASAVTNVLVFSGVADRQEQFADKIATEIMQPSDLTGSLTALAADDIPATP